MDVTLYGKRDFADVIRLMVLRCGRFSWIMRAPEYNHRGPYMRETKDSTSKAVA